jgi:uncharacterized protein
MSDMRRHVLYSFSHGGPERGMSRSAFRLDPGKEKGPSRFEADLIVDGIWHQYGLVIDDAQVLEEWAYRYPRGNAGAAANHPDLAPHRRWFADNLLLAEASSRGRRWAYTAGMLLHEQHHDQVLGLLQAANLGITDARVRETDAELLERMKRAARIPQGREDELEDTDSEVSILEPGLGRGARSRPRPSLVHGERSRWRKQAIRAF